MKNKEYKIGFFYFLGIAFLAHLFILLFFFFFSSLPEKKEKRGKLVVKTILAVADNPKPSETPSPSLKPIQTPAPKAPLPPKPVNKPIKKEEPPPKSLKPVLKKQAETKPQQTPQKWAQVRDALKGLNEKPVFTGSKIESTVSSDFQKADGYDVRLIMHLKESLRLPEKGAVKVLLRISKTGELLDLKIISCESSQNRLFVESSLKKMRFPPFDQSLKEKKEEEFLVTLEGI